MLSPPRRTPSQYAYSNSITEIPSLQNNVLRKVASLTLTGNTKSKPGAGGAAKQAGGKKAGAGAGSNKTNGSSSGGGSTPEGEATVLSVISGAALVEWFARGRDQDKEQVKELAGKCCELLLSIGVLEKVKGQGKGDGVKFDSSGSYRWTNVCSAGSPASNRSSPERESQVEKGQGEALITKGELIEEEDTAAACKAGN